VGRVPIAGRAGLNRVRFNGTVRLEPGTYSLKATSRANGQRLWSTFATIIDPRAPLKVYARPKCSAVSVDLAAAAPPPRGAVAAVSGFVATVRGGSAKPTAGRARSADGERTQVLGEVSPPGVGVSIGATYGGSRKILPELALLVSVIGLLISLVLVIYGSLRRGRPLY